MTALQDPTSILNLDRHIGQRQTSYHFYLSTVTGEQLGEVHPSMEASATLSHDSTTTVSRKVQGITLVGDDALIFDPLRHRISITMEIAGVGEFAMGRYMSSDSVSSPYLDGTTGRAGRLLPLSLVDEMAIIDQRMSDSYMAQGQLTSECIRELLYGLPIDDPDIEISPSTCNGAWSIGSSRATALSDMAATGGYFLPWFGNDGKLHMVMSFDPAARPPSIDWDINQLAIRSSATVTDETVSAPNMFIAISNDTGTTGNSYVGTYQIPSSAPHSIANLGYSIPAVKDIQVTSAEYARLYARTWGIQETVSERLELDTPPDPRHDGFTVVRFNGMQWLEIGWSLTLKAGGPMRHTLRRAYEIVDISEH